jgi:Ca2+-binding RTX toxin-like protein
MPSDFLPLNQYRLDVEGTTNQRLSMRGIEQLGLTGGPGNNRIDVSRFQGGSSLFGGAGNDFLVSSSGSSLLEGQDGDDQLFGSFGSDTLRGGNGNDLLMGDSGNDLLEGGAGRDILMGGTGIDQLFGGTGDDILLGGYALDLLRDANAANRNSILARWANPSTYAERTTDLLQGLNGPALIPSIGVFNDFAADSFFGEAGRDWFFASESEVDPVTGRVGDSIAGELETKFS